MVRRSANQLVQQGILPDLKTSPAIHEQKQKLERAKTGDLLKAKIQQRPNRQELERRHILESHESHIDPSLAEKYRMLEKAILVDQLNSKISHRPGPLELIEKNILHANEPIERIVKEGLVEYKLMSVDDNVVFEDDSQSSEGDLQSKSETILLATPNYIEQQPQPSTSNSTTAILNGNVIKLNLAMTPVTTATVIPKLTIKLPSDSSISHQINENFVTNPPPPPPPLIIKEMPSLDPIKPQPLQVTSIPPPPLAQTTFTPENNTIKNHISSFIQNNQKIGSSGKDKNRKKCKIKPPIKSKAIKFHEYKGPPNANKSSASSSSQLTAAAVNNKKVGETNYELIMQQQCLLEYLEGIYKSPKSQELSDSAALEINANSMDKITPLKHQENDVIKKEDSKKPFVTIFPSKAPQNTTTSVNSGHVNDGVISDMNQLSKLKVSELKAFLKKFSLPVSGPKPLLVERLKPYLPLKLGDAEKNEDKKEVKTLMELSAQPPSHAMVIDAEKQAEGGDDIVREQQRKIEELQRKLQESQQQLEQIKQIKQENFSSPQSSNGNAPAVPEKETNFFQLIPTTSNDLQNNLLYDQKSYQIASPISTVFVVAGVSQPSLVLAPESTSINTLPMILQAEDNCKTVDNTIASTPQSIMMMSEDTNDGNDDSEEYEDNEVTSNIMQDDISDVLEILLKNEKWPESPSAIKNNSDEHHQQQQQPVLQSNILSSTFHDTPSLSEPMSPLLSNDVSIGNYFFFLYHKSNDKKFVGKTTSSHTNISSNFEKHENDINCNSNFVDCPMDIEDSSSMLMDSNLSDFKTSLAIKKSPPHHQHLNNNNNHMLSGFDTTKSLDVGVTNGVVGGVKNSLIGNFDNNMFDTFKNNNNACNNNANFFSNTSEHHSHKELKESERGYMNNLSILNNFELFSNSGMELSVPMDFENIIPYDIYQQDTFFNNINNTLQNSTHDHRDSFNSAFFTPGNHDSNDMFSEVDNFLESVSEKV